MSGLLPREAEWEHGRELWWCTITMVFEGGGAAPAFGSISRPGDRDLLRDLLRCLEHCWLELVEDTAEDETAEEPAAAAAAADSTAAAAAAAVTEQLAEEEEALVTAAAAAGLFTVEGGCCCWVTGELALVTAAAATAACVLFRSLLIFRLTVLLYSLLSLSSPLPHWPMEASCARVQLEGERRSIELLEDLDGGVGGRGGSTGRIGDEEHMTLAPAVAAAWEEEEW